MDKMIMEMQTTGTTEREKNSTKYDKEEFY